jgi:hypothetical protein
MKKISEIIIEKTKGLDLKAVERMALGLCKSGSRGDYNSLTEDAQGWGLAAAVVQHSYSKDGGFAFFFTETDFVLNMTMADNDVDKGANLSKPLGVINKSGLNDKAKKALIRELKGNGADYWTVVECVSGKVKDMARIYKAHWPKFENKHMM